MVCYSLGSMFSYECWSRYAECILNGCCRIAGVRGNGFGSRVCKLEFGFTV